MSHTSTSNPHNEHIQGLTAVVKTFQYLVDHQEMRLEKTDAESDELWYEDYILKIAKEAIAVAPEKQLWFLLNELTKVKADSRNKESKLVNTESELAKVEKELAAKELELVDAKNQSVSQANDLDRKDETIAALRAKLEGQRKEMSEYFQNRLLGDRGLLGHRSSGMEDLQNGFEKLRETFARLAGVSIDFDSDIQEDFSEHDQQSKERNGRMAESIKSDNSLDEREKVMVDDEVATSPEDSQSPENAADSDLNSAIKTCIEPLTGQPSHSAITIPAQRQYRNKHKRHRVKP